MCPFSDQVYSNPVDVYTKPKEAFSPQLHGLFPRLGYNPKGLAFFPKLPVWKEGKIMDCEK